jgi:hypothetical protein
MTLFKVSTQASSILTVTHVQELAFACEAGSRRTQNPCWRTWRGPGSMKWGESERERISEERFLYACTLRHDAVGELSSVYRELYVGGAPVPESRSILRRRR